MLDLLVVIEFTLSLIRPYLEYYSIDLSTYLRSILRCVSSPLRLLLPPQSSPRRRAPRVLQMHTDFKILILVRHNLEGFQEFFEKYQVETQLTQAKFCSN